MGHVLSGTPIEPIVLEDEDRFDGDRSALWPPLLLLPPPRRNNKSFQFLAFGEPKSLSGIFLWEDDLRVFITGDIESEASNSLRDAELCGECSACKCCADCGCCTLSSQYVDVDMLAVAAVFCGSASCLPCRSILK